MWCVILEELFRSPLFVGWAFGPCSRARLCFRGDLGEGLAHQVCGPAGGIPFYGGRRGQSPPPSGVDDNPTQPNPKILES